MPTAIATNLVSDITTGLMRWISVFWFARVEMSVERWRG
jgi:hypothetical protein